MQYAAPPRAESDRTNGQSALGAAFTLVKCNWGIGMSECLPAMPTLLAVAGLGNWDDSQCSRSQVTRCPFVAAVAMPYMLDQAGTIAGVIMFIISMALTQLSIDRLLDVAAALPRRSTSVSAHKPLLGAPAETEATGNLVRAQHCSRLRQIAFVRIRQRAV